MANTKITNPELFNLGANNTAATQLPVMTTTQRIAMNVVPTSNIDYLVVAGGGAGGGGGQAGGGGAGGLRTNYGGASLTLNTATAYTVTVGAGGIGTGNGVSGSGSNSVFDYITSTITSAGGGGGAIHNISGADGGSGGGAGTQQTGGSGNTPSTTPSQGNAGGSGGTYNFPYSGGGGGGYVSVGSTGGNVSGNGGTGIAYTAANSITGSALSLAGGGGGGTYSGAAGTATNGGGAGFSGTGTTAYGSPGTPGTDNTGGGGGGTGNYQVGTIGASGGSGIVILRYPTADVASYTATGLTPTETTVGTDTVLSFTTVGTGTITFTSPTPTGTISTGEMIFNSTTDKVEYFDGTKWYGITYEVGKSLYNNVLYDGQATDLSVTNVGFTPDLVWIKCRDVVNSHVLSDSLRGDSTRMYSLFPDLTAAQNTTSNNVETIDSDGFTVFGDRSATNRVNQEYVAWCWKAGGAAVTTTPAGGLASEVSANVANGFSIVKFTSDSSAGLKIAHGLSSAPEMIIYKKLNGSQAWYVNTNQVNGNRSEGVLNTNAAFTNVGSAWSSMSTSTLINSFTSTNGTNYMAYCFHSVAGVSKVGSYTGTGAGTTVTTGFEPAFVMIKKTSGSADWIIWDNKRGSNILKPNTSAAEVVLTNYITYNSTGFTFPTSDSAVNVGDFIFMSFA